MHNQLLKYSEKNEPVRMGDIATYFDGISRNTLRKDVQYLVQEGAIEKLGKGKGTIYVLPLPQ